MAVFSAVDGEYLKRDDSQGCKVDPSNIWRVNVDCACTRVPSDVSVYAQYVNTSESYSRDNFRTGA